VVRAPPRPRAGFRVFENGCRPICAGTATPSPTTMLRRPPRDGRPEEPMKRPSAKNSPIKLAAHSRGASTNHAVAVGEHRRAARSNSARGGAAPSSIMPSTRPDYISIVAPSPRAARLRSCGNIVRRSKPSPGNCRAGLVDAGRKRPSIVAGANCSRRPASPRVRSIGWATHAPWHGPSQTTGYSFVRRRSRETASPISSRSRA